MKLLKPLCTAMTGVALSLTLASCGGGGSPTAPAVATISKTTTKAATQKSVDSAAEASNARKRASRATNTLAGRAARKASLVTQTSNGFTLTNELDAATGCISNGSLTYSENGNTFALNGSWTDTQCSDPTDNGVFTLSGTMTSNDNVNYAMSVSVSFQETGTNLKLTGTITGATNMNTDATTISTVSIGLNGQASDGYAYSNFTVATASNGKVNMSGTITDPTGYDLTFQSASLNSDGSGTMTFTTEDGVKMAMTLNADGSGTATLTQSNNGASLGSVTWNSSGAATLNYADGTNETLAV